MLSYTKAIIDYELATQHEEKILENKEKLVKVKVYLPSNALLDWRESVAETRGDATKATEDIKAFVKALEKELKVKAVFTGWNTPPTGTDSDDNKGKVLLVVKTMNNRYKLAGNFCIRLYYAVSSDKYIHFPADPDVVTQWNAKEFVAIYSKILGAHSVSKDYVKKLRERTVVLRDEF